MQHSWPVNDAFRAAIFWSFNDDLDTSRLIRQMDALIAAGINPGFIHTRVGLVTPYLSQAWMDIVSEVVQAAREREQTVWLYDEDRWPSGYGGGRVTTQAPELAGGALALLPADAKDPHIVEVLGACEQDGKRYQFALMREKNGESSWFGGGAYPDFLNPRAMEVFLKTVHEPYKARLSDSFGSTIQGVFFDEPTYVRRGTYPCIPFTASFDTYFQRAYGYSLLPHLPALFFDEGDYHRVRLHFYTLATRLFVDHFTRQYHHWCRKNDLLLTGHFVHEDTLTWQAEFTGAVMPHYAQMDIPGIDKLGLGNDKLMTVLQVTSVAEQLGKRSLCEALGCLGHQSGPMQMKSLTDWLAALGISFINPHLALYSMRGERKRDYPPNISWMQPWFSVSRPYWDHVARVSEAVCAGHSEVTLLVLHPIASVWAEMSPLHKHHPVSSIWQPPNKYDRENFATEVECWEKPFMDLTEQLYAQGLWHHYGDELILEEHARIEAGRFCVGKMQYRTVVIPPVSVLRKNTIALLKAFAAQSGQDAVVFMERFPDWVEGEEGAADIAAWATCLPNRDAVLNHVTARNETWIRALDTTTGQVAEAVFINARKQDGYRHAFVANTDTRSRCIRIQADIAMDAVDTMTGDVLRIPGEGSAFSVTLREGGSLLLAERREARPEKEASYLPCGADFRGCLPLLSMQQPAGKPLAENLLPLERATLSTPEGTHENLPISFLWPVFYALPEGAPFTLSYRFTVDAMPSSPVYAMIEMARNLERITLNDQSLTIGQTEAEQGCFDFSYDRMLLTSLCKGENTLTLIGKKCNNIIGMANHRAVPANEIHRPTELEAVYLTGSFAVAEGSCGSSIMANHAPLVQGELCKAGFPYYAGKVVYEIEIPQGATWLEMDAAASAASLEANGTQQASYLMPFTFDVSALQGHRVTLTLYSSLANSHGPVHLAGRDQLKMLGPSLMYNQKLYQEEPVLIPFGVYSVKVYGKG